MFVLSTLIDSLSEAALQVLSTDTLTGPTVAVTVRMLILLLPSTLATAIFLYLHYSAASTSTPPITLHPPPPVHHRQPLHLPARTPIASMESLSEAEERSLEYESVQEYDSDSSYSHSPGLPRAPNRSHSHSHTRARTSPYASSHSRSSSFSNPNSRTNSRTRARSPSNPPPTLHVFRIIDRISRYYRDAGPYNSSLADLTLLLQEELEVDCVLVGVPGGGGLDHSVATAVFCWKGEILEDIEYSLKDSPCELVAGKFLSTEADKLHYYNGNVCSVFPEDQWLVDKGITTYYGLPVILHSKLKGTATKIGIFVIMHSEPFSRSKHQLVESLSYIVRDRIAASLELEFLRKTVDTTISSLSGEIQKLGVLNSELYHQLSQSQSGNLHCSGEFLGGKG